MSVLLLLAAAAAVPLIKKASRYDPNWKEEERECQELRDRADRIIEAMDRRDDRRSR